MPITNEQSWIWGCFRCFLLIQPRAKFGTVIVFVQNTIGNRNSNYRRFCNSQNQRKQQEVELRFQHREMELRQQQKELEKKDHMERAKKSSKWQTQKDEATGIYCSLLIKGTNSSDGFSLFREPKKTISINSVKNNFGSCRRQNSRKNQELFNQLIKSVHPSSRQVDHLLNLSLGLVHAAIAKEASVSTVQTLSAPARFLSLSMRTKLPNMVLGKCSVHFLD